MPQIASNLLGQCIFGMPFIFIYCSLIPIDILIKVLFAYRSKNFNAIDLLFHLTPYKSERSSLKLL